jgi:hypothetical protein
LDLQWMQRADRCAWVDRRLIHTPPISRPVGRTPKTCSRMTEAAVKLWHRARALGARQAVLETRPASGAALRAAQGFVDIQTTALQQVPTGQVNNANTSSFQLTPGMASISAANSGAPRPPKLHAQCPGTLPGPHRTRIGCWCTARVGTCNGHRDLNLARHDL